MKFLKERYRVRWSGGKKGRAPSPWPWSAVLYTPVHIWVFCRKQWLSMSAAVPVETPRFSFVALITCCYAGSYLFEMLWRCFWGKILHQDPGRQLFLASVNFFFTGTADTLFEALMFIATQSFCLFWFSPLAFPLVQLNSLKWIVFF